MMHEAQPCEPTGILSAKQFPLSELHYKTLVLSCLFLWGLDAKQALELARSIWLPLCWVEMKQRNAYQASLRRTL